MKEDAAMEMHSSPPTEAQATDATRTLGEHRARPLERAVGGLLGRALGAALSQLRCGSLALDLPDGRRIEGRGQEPGPSGLVRVHAWRCLWQLLVAGDVAFAEAYVRGEWSTPDLASVIEVVARNRDAVDRAMSGFGPARALDWVVHRLRANSKSGSRRNIAAHYDLGNDFYAAWLDAEMVYSSAIWPDEGVRARASGSVSPTRAGESPIPPTEAQATASLAIEGRGPEGLAADAGTCSGLPGWTRERTERGAVTLEAAQARKLDRVVELVGAQPGHRVLEIGVGWGALAARLAQRVGAHVTGLTLSRHQLAHVQARAAADGLSHLVEARYEDYRDATGTFDRIVSVEMIEAVGRAYWPAYFRTLRDRLCPSGHAIVQAITIDHARLDAYAAKPDFIQVHVFPGGMLPSIEAMAEEAARAGLSFACVERFGGSYARTLAEWRRRFVEAWPHIERMGFDEAFRRKWEYYLGYCEGGFRAGAIDVGLYRLAPVGGLT